MNDWVAVEVLPARSSTVPLMDMVPSVSVVSWVRVRVVVQVFEETEMLEMVWVLEPLVKVRSTSEVESALVVVPDTVTPLLSSEALTYPPDTAEIVRVGAVASVAKEMDSAAPCAQAPFW